VTGRPYAAGDPALLLWVHGALVDSVLAAGNLVGTALPAADSNRYVAEMVTAPNHPAPGTAPAEFSADRGAAAGPIGAGPPRSDEQIY
jgi:uncharacterized protein (DUF2236 family)